MNIKDIEVGQILGKTTGTKKTGWKVLAIDSKYSEVRASEVKTGTVDIFSFSKDRTDFQLIEKAPSK